MELVGSLLGSFFLKELLFGALLELLVPGLQSLLAGLAGQLGVTSFLLSALTGGLPVSLDLLLELALHLLQFLIKIFGWWRARDGLSHGGRAPDYQLGYILLRGSLLADAVDVRGLLLGHYGVCGAGWPAQAACR